MSEGQVLHLLEPVGKKGSQNYDLILRGKVFIFDTSHTLDANSI